MCIRDRIIDTSNGNAVVGTHTVTSQEATSGITTQDITLSTLAVGIHALKAQLTDLAGNAGTVSTTATAVTVDTAALSPTLALATDNGSNTSDGITNVGTVNVSGLETGATWEYRTTDSASWTLGTGNSFTLSAGTYAANNVQVRQTDAAGNVSSAGMITTAITVDTTVPVSRHRLTVASMKMLMLLQSFTPLWQLTMRLSPILFPVPTLTY